MKKKYILLVVFSISFSLLFGAGNVTPSADRNVYPFNNLISPIELNQLEMGEIVIRNIGKYQNMCMIHGVQDVADKVMDMFSDLDPKYLAEVIYMMPAKNNDDIVNQADAVFSDISLYKEIIYYDEDTGKSTQLFPISELVEREDKDGCRRILSHVKMDMLAPYNTELIINTTPDTFFFSQINQEPMKLGFVTAIKPKNMKASICCFKYGENWIVYAAGGVVAPKVPFLQKKIERQFIGRIRDFTVYYIKHFNIVR